MKINEIGTVVQHPAVQAEAEFVNLLQSTDIDEVTAFIMDDRNAKARRLYMLRHLDELLGDPQDSYTEDDLQDFMYDNRGWEDELRDYLDDINIEKGHWNKGDNLSDEEIYIQMAKDLKIPPYHLSPVEEETFSSDADIPTGEYEICTRCFGDGCDECEGGLKDVTGQFEIPNFGDD